MSTRVEAVVPTRQEPRASGSWFGRRTAAALGLAVGVALGVVLALVSVILPRTRELARWRQGSVLVREFALQPMLDAAAPGVAWSMDSSTESDWRTNRPWGRVFDARARLAPSEQGKLVQAINDRLIADIRGRGGNAYPSGNFQWSGAGSEAKHQMIHYELEEALGSIHVRGIGHGDAFSLVVSIHEH